MSRDYPSNFVGGLIVIFIVLCCINIFLEVSETREVATDVYRLNPVERKVELKHNFPQFEEIPYIPIPIEEINYKFESPAAYRSPSVSTRSLLSFEVEISLQNLNSDGLPEVPMKKECWDSELVRFKENAIIERGLRYKCTLIGYGPDELTRIYYWEVF